MSLNIFMGGSVATKTLPDSIVFNLGCFKRLIGGYSVCFMQTRYRKNNINSVNYKQKHPSGFLNGL